MISNKLKYFKVAAELGNITKAAETLNVSQPSITRTIKQLEDELGVDLFNRGNRGVELSEFGKSFYRHISFIDQELFQARNELEMMKSLDLQKVIIGSGLVWMHQILPSVISDVLLSRPNSRFEVYAGHSKIIFNAFISGRYDLILCDLIELPRVMGVTYEKIADITYTFVARQDHPLFQMPDEERTKATGQFDLAVFEHTREDSSCSGIDIWKLPAKEQNRVRYVTTSLSNLLETLTYSDLITPLPITLKMAATRFGVKEITPELRRTVLSSGAVYRSESNIQPFVSDLVSRIRSTYQTVYKKNSSWEIE